jgi:hypothetical protein
MARSGIVGRSEVTQPTSEWASFRNVNSGAKIAYPPGWIVLSCLCPALKYPRESFSLLSAPMPGRLDDDLPNLKAYPRDEVLLWLLHYDRIAEANAKAFGSGIRFDRLPRRTSEFAGFDRYGLLFSGSRRTFLLRLWVGERTSRSTRMLLRHSLASLWVP